MVELESSNSKILTKKGIPTETLNTAIKQVKDWNNWIEANKRTFITDLISRMEMLPNYPKKHKNKSFMFGGSAHVMEQVNNWGGIDLVHCTYTIILGRWSKLTKEEKQYIVQENRIKSNLHDVFTYEQLIRTSLSRFYKLLP